MYVEFYHTHGWSAETVSSLKSSFWALPLSDAEVVVGKTPSGLWNQNKEFLNIIDFWAKAFSLLAFFTEAISMVALHFKQAQLPSSLSTDARFLQLWNHWKKSKY